MSEKTAADTQATRAAQKQSDREVPDQNEPEQETQAAPEPAPSADETATANETAASDAGLEAALAEAQARAEENWNQYLRAMAELDNTRKRASRDVEQAHRFALERFVAELLPVKDSLEMGLNAAADAQDRTGALLEGVTATLKLLAQAFEKFGIAEIDPRGERFDPERHEAMAAQPSADAEPGTVLTVVQKGYLLNGRVLRPARVLVAKRPDEEGAPPA